MVKTSKQIGEKKWYRSKNLSFKHNKNLHVAILLLTAKRCMDTPQTFEV